MSPTLLLLPFLGLAACGAPSSPPGTPPPAPAPAPVHSAGGTPTALPDSAYWRSYYEGAWVGIGDEGYPGLACGRTLSVAFDGEPDVRCVVPNQIWITVRWALDAEAGVAHLYLVDPDDVGRGGAGLPWGDFSRAHPLATLEPTPGEGRFATLVWHGFRMAGGEPYGGDFGGWLAGDYEPADGDTRLPVQRRP